MTRHLCLLLEVPRDNAGEYYRYALNTPPRADSESNQHESGDSITSNMPKVYGFPTVEFSHIPSVKGQSAIDSAKICKHARKNNSGGAGRHLCECACVCPRDRQPCGRWWEVTHPEMSVRPDGGSLTSFPHCPWSGGQNRPDAEKTVSNRQGVRLENGGQGGCGRIFPIQPH